MPVGMRPYNQEGRPAPMQRAWASIAERGLRPVLRLLDLGTQT